MPWAVLAFTGGLSSASLKRRYGRRRLTVASGLFSAASFTVLALRHGSYVEFALAAGAAGFASGLLAALMAGLVVDSVAAEHVGTAAGVNGNMRTIGGAIGSTSMATLIAATAAGGAATESGYALGFGLLAVVMVAAAAGGVLMTDR